MTTDDAAARRVANRAVLERVFAAIGSQDAAAFGDLYTSDYVLELPYAHPEPVRLEGLREVASYLGGALTTFRFTLSLTAVHELVDPDVLVAEYVSDGVVTTTGKPYANTYIGIWRFRGGRVCGTKEFYDPLISKLALEPDGPAPAATD